MRLLIDVLHPAHVHVFRNLAGVLVERGHEVRWTLRDKDVARELFDQYGLRHQVLSRKRTGVGLAFEFLERVVRLERLVVSYQPHFLTGIMGPTIAPVARLSRLLRLNRARAAVFYDTEIATLTNSFVYPLADYVCTPDSYKGRVRGHHLTYAGYHELAYLHPTRFTPSPEVVRAVGIDPGSPYFVLRFVSYEASHDLGTRGLLPPRKLALVQALREHGRVLISSEGPLPSELEPYRIRIPVHQIHHVLAFARLVVGESATMASEAAVLGVPAVYVSPLGRGYTDEQERRYGLVHNFTGAKFHADVATYVARLARDAGLSEQARHARERLLSEKVDVTAWMLDFFEREFHTHFGT